MRLYVIKEVNINIWNKKKHFKIIENDCITLKFYSIYIYNFDIVVTVTFVCKRLTFGEQCIAIICRNIIIILLNLLSSLFAK